MFLFIVPCFYKLEILLTLSTDLSNPVDTVFHLQPVMILTLIPLACFIDGTSDVMTLVNIISFLLIFRSTFRYFTKNISS